MGLGFVEGSGFLGAEIDPGVVTGSDGERIVHIGCGVVVSGRRDGNVVIAFGNFGEVDSLASIGEPGEIIRSGPFGHGNGSAGKRVFGLVDDPVSVYIFKEGDAELSVTEVRRRGRGDGCGCG